VKPLTENEKSLSPVSVKLGAGQEEECHAGSKRSCAPWLSASPAVSATIFWYKSRSWQLATYMATIAWPIEPQTGKNWDALAIPASSVFDDLADLEYSEPTMGAQCSSSTCSDCDSRRRARPYRCVDKDFSNDNWAHFEATGNGGQCKIVVKVAMYQCPGLDNNAMQCSGWPTDCYGKISGSTANMAHMDKACVAQVCSMREESCPKGQILAKMETGLHESSDTSSCQEWFVKADALLRIKFSFFRQNYNNMFIRDCFHWFAAGMPKYGGTAAEIAAGTHAGTCEDAGGSGTQEPSCEAGSSCRGLLWRNCKPIDPNVKEAPGTEEGCLE